MKSLPIFQSQSKEMSLLQTSWASSINTLLKNPLLVGIILPNVSLVSGDNVINHRLGRKQQGYIVVDQTAAASIYRSQPFNELTLTLNSSANVEISIYAY